MTIEIGQRVRISPLTSRSILVDDLLRLQETAAIGTVYSITQWQYSPNNIGVDFGIHERWWFVESELEVVK